MEKVWIFQDPFFLYPSPETNRKFAPEMRAPGSLEILIFISAEVTSKRSLIRKSYLEYP